MGLGNMEGAEIFEEDSKDKKAPVKEEVKPKEAKQLEESDFLFDKKCNCPVCQKDFTYPAVKTGKARLIGVDEDLRGRYQNFDPNKYQIIACPHCGYAASLNAFPNVSSGQIKLFKTNIGGKVQGIKEKSLLSYDEAVSRYQVALACAIVMKMRDSEKANVALRLAWCIRGKKEELEHAIEAASKMLPKPGEGDIAAAEEELGITDARNDIKKLEADEQEAIKVAYEGFVSARASEHLPIAGMDEHTLDYLLGVLAFNLGEYSDSAKLIAAVITAKYAPERIKEKARLVKEKLLQLKNQ